ncbi:lactonase family protein [Streptomyces orinoci]|uniref:Lactonase family protein n=1 Tax=Streptomyces orinoci TaxID=67339 RepID=A0ABV3JRN5_STRON|nr:lactonase family protein [Streptomyces orinoci]
MSGNRAYLGSFTEAGGPGLTTARLDARTGALTPVHATDAVANPSFLTAGPGALYAVSETADGSVAAFSLADPLSPTPLAAPVPVRGDAPTHLALCAGHLFTANYGSGSVSALPLRADGTLGGPSAVLAHRGRGPVSGRQEGPHAHAVVPDPSGGWLLAVDLGTDSVSGYPLDPVTGAPGAPRETRLRPGMGPRQLVFHPGGRRAYVLGELESVLTVCRWDAGDGTLRPLAEVPVVPPGSGVENFPSTPVISADGRFLWVANRGRDSIVTFALDPSGDRPEFRAEVDCGGHWPRHLAAHPDGHLLYAANERSGDITRFTVDPGTGVPRRAGSLAMPAASCVVFG